LHAPRRRFEIQLDCDKRQSACRNRFAPIRQPSADLPEGKPAPRPTIELTSSRLISDYSLFKEHTEKRQRTIAFSVKRLQLFWADAIVISNDTFPLPGCLRPRRWGRG
jgi:hypothetical protein